MAILMIIKQCAKKLLIQKKLIVSYGNTSDYQTVGKEMINTKKTDCIIWQYFWLLNCGQRND